MTEKTVVELTDVCLRIGDQTILDRISLRICREEIMTIIGPNGAGKSSLIKLIAGLLQPSSGELKKQSKLVVGYVPQKLFLNQSMPIKVSRFLSLSQASKTTCRAALGQVNAQHLWPKQMHALSGGELQRVLLARAIARKPDLLVLDEPLQGVDVNGQTELYRLIASLRSSIGCAVVMVSHDLHLVMAQTDQVICLNHHVCCHGKPESISQHPEYLNLFGRQSAKDIAVYTHHHDHHHELDGEVASCTDTCRHD